MSALSILEFANPNSELAQQIQSAPPKAENIYLNTEINELRQMFEMWKADIFNESKGHQPSLKFINRELEYLCDENN